MASLIDAAKEFVTDAVASIEKPEATVTDVNVKRVKFGSVTYNAKVNVSNPYSTPIPIGEIRYVLKSFGSVIVTGAIPDPGSLKGNGDTMLDVEINVPHSVLISLLKDIATDWDIDYELQVNLVVDLPVIGEFSIPVTTSGQVKLPTVNNYFTKLEGYPRNVAVVVVAGLVVVAVAWWWRLNVKSLNEAQNAL